MTLNYSNYQIDEILRLEKPENLFSILKVLDWKDHDVSWSDIFKGLEFYYKHKEYLDRQLPKHLTNTHIQLLVENFGFDVNFKDRYGNNLLLFASKIIDSPTNSAGSKYFFDYCIEEIINMLF